MSESDRSVLSLGLLFGRNFEGFDAASSRPSALLTRRFLLEAYSFLRFVDFVYPGAHLFSTAWRHSSWHGWHGIFAIFASSGNRLWSRCRWMTAWTQVFAWANITEKSDANTLDDGSIVENRKAPRSQDCKIYTHSPSTRRHAIAASSVSRR